MTGRVFGEVVSWTRSGVHVGVIDSGGLGRLVAAGSRDGQTAAK